MKIILAISLFMFCTACNQKVEFPDNTVQAVYFPIQYPVRTLVLGEDRIDNTIDRQHAFDIGVCIGGMYENKKDWFVDFEIANDLAQDIKINSAADGNAIATILPSAYYTLVPDTRATIKKGSFNGLIRVQLSDAFFNDPKAHSLNYVLPLRITSSDCDSILRGQPVVNNPNKHLSSDWSANAKPRDYTLFAVKYINPWHGTFFHRGVQKKNGTVDKIFHARDLESNQTAQVVTAGMNKTVYKRMGEFFNGVYESELIFSEDTSKDGEEGTIEVKAVSGSAFAVSGTGRYYKSSTDFAKEHGAWLVDPNTGKEIPHLTMTLDFKVEGIGSDEYNFVDTLVFRNNGVKFEQFTVVTN